jgi:hypothetical protein
MQCSIGHELVTKLMSTILMGKCPLHWIGPQVISRTLRMLSKQVPSIAAICEVICFTNCKADEAEV